HPPAAAHRPYTTLFRSAALWTDLWRSPTDLCTADRNLCTALGTTNYSTVVRGNPLSATDPRDTNDSRPSSEERFGTLRWTTSPRSEEHTSELQSRFDLV